MRITIAEVRRVIRDVIGEAFSSPGTGFKLVGPDGVEYEGERNAVRSTIVSSSRLDAAARNEVMDTGSAPAEVIFAQARWPDQANVAAKGACAARQSQTAAAHDCTGSESI